MDSRPIIQIRELTVFQDLHPVLRRINLDIQRGEFVFLTGQTGSGKTSLLKILYADLPIKAGTVDIAGFKLHQLSARDVPLLRRKIGIVFQDFQLLIDRNIEQNLFFVLKATGWKDKLLMRKRVTDVLMRVGLDWAAKKMSHQLSGGEQQRIAIARALLNDPVVLIADEPTGNLDPKIAHGILSLFQEINRGGTAVLMATHNYDLLAKHPTRVLRCQHNAVIDIPKTNVDT